MPAARTAWRIAGVALLAATLQALPAGAAAPPQPQPKLTLHVAGLAPGATLPRSQAFDKDGCHGDNRSPALYWSGAATRTGSYAITVFDRDARGGRGWWHWVAWNIPASRSGLPVNASHTLARDFKQAENDFGTLGYGGPCPPPGKAHHYIFTLYALPDSTLTPPAHASAADIALSIRAHASAHTIRTFTYQR